MNTKTDKMWTDSTISGMHFLSHPSEPADRYAEYLYQGDDQTINSTRNLKNMFADSNREDIKWLTLARRYLQKRKSLGR